MPSNKRVPTPPAQPGPACTLTSVSYTLLLPQQHSSFPGMTQPLLHAL